MNLSYAAQKAKANNRGRKEAESRRPGAVITKTFREQSYENFTIIFTQFSFVSLRKIIYLCNVNQQSKLNIFIYGY